MSARGVHSHTAVGWRRRHSAGRVALLALIAAIGTLIAARVAPSQEPGAPGDSQAADLFARAAQLVQHQDLSAAEQIYEQILRSSPNSFEALNNLGVVDAHLGKYSDAAAAYERALRLRPDSFPLWLNLGLAYFKGHEFAAAVKPFERAAALNPANFQASALLAMSNFWAGQYQGAAAQLEKLDSARPGNSALEYLLAESYLETGQYQKLLAFVAQDSHRPFSPAATELLRGEANAGLNRRAEAIENFKAAAAADPAQAGVHFGLGVLYWEQHDARDAAKEFWREMEGAGLVSESEAYLGTIALSQGRSRQARAYFEQALRLEPKPPLAYYGLAVLEARERNYSAAESQLKAALRGDPGMRLAHALLARVYRAKGERRLAASEMKAARALPASAGVALFKLIPPMPPA